LSQNGYGDFCTQLALPPSPPDQLPPRSASPVARSHSGAAPLTRCPQSVPGR